MPRWALASQLCGARTRDVACDLAVPIEEFNFIVTDECHRSIYNLWRQVLEYFDAFLIDLPGAPATQTIAYFHQNRVAEYNHERAVADGVNAGYDVYRIKTRVGEQGGTIEKGFLVDHRSRASRAARQAVPEGDLDYTPADLDHLVAAHGKICIGTIGIRTLTCLYCACILNLWIQYSKLRRFFLTPRCSCVS